MLCAHFSLCSVQFVARYSLRSSQALRARWARFAGPLRGVLIVQCIILEGGDPSLKMGGMDSSETSEPNFGHGSAHFS